MGEFTGGTGLGLVDETGEGTLSGVLVGEGGESVGVEKEELEEGEGDGGGGEGGKLGVVLGKVGGVLKLVGVDSGGGGVG